MSHKFRMISNAVAAGRKLNDLVKDQRNVAFFMEPDGPTYICTLTDEEKVSGHCFLVSGCGQSDFDAILVLMTLEKKRFVETSGAYASTKFITKFCG